MNKKAYFVTIGTIFSFIAIVHFLRISFSWSFIIGDWFVPTWVSGLVVLIALLLTIQAFRFTKHNEADPTDKNTSLPNDNEPEDNDLPNENA